MRLACACAAALLASVIVQAQNQQRPAQPPQEQPTFRTGAALVRVDVTVTDRRGEPVNSLTADDFSIQEDGVPQAVATFKLVSADGRPAEDDDTSLPIRSPEHAASEAARDDVRVFLIFWDEYHIHRFPAAIVARRALADFVGSAFGPTDLVALMDPLTPTDAIRWTRNRTDLVQAVHKLEGRYREYTPVRSVLEEAQLMRRDVERVRTEVTISAVKSAASYLGGLREGRKAIILVSEGLPALDRSDEPSLLQDLVRTANNNNTAIYTLDPRGLGAGVSDQLMMLSDNTGAEAFVNTNNPEKALRQVVKDASAFYLLGYASTRNPADGKFHQIKVRVKRPGIEVRARKGYWAPTLDDMTRAAKEAAAAPSDEISTALLPLATRSERALDLWIGTSWTASNTPQVLVTWVPRSTRSAREGSTLAIVAQREDGRMETFEAPFDGRRFVFEAEPGALQLRTTLRDAHGDTLDEETRTLSVPDLVHASVALGSPIVIRAANAVELRAVHADRNPFPFPGREFTRTDRAFVRFNVYGDHAAEAVVSARLLSRVGSALRTLPVAPPSPQVDTHEIDLPLAALARGDYLVEITATAGDDRAEVLVPLRVVS